MQLIEEVWKDIDECDGFYQVSNLGRVRSVDRYIERMNNGTMSKQFCKGRILKQNVDEDGYFRINIRLDRKDKRFGVHRLVAATFISNPDNLPCVNHINGNKQDNSVENLEWCTVAYNNHHAEKIGLRPHSIYEDRNAVKAKLSKPVKCIENGVVYSSYTEAEKSLNLGSTAVFHSIKYKRKTKSGYTFVPVN